MLLPLFEFISFYSLLGLVVILRNTRCSEWSAPTHSCNVLIPLQRQNDNCLK